MDAIAFYANHWQETDLVILNMMMPDIGGRDMFRARKKINPDIEAILSSDCSVESEIQWILDDGVIAFLSKPFGYIELPETLADSLGRDKSF